MVANRLPWPASQLINTDGTPCQNWTYNFSPDAYSDDTLVTNISSVTLNAYGRPDVDVYLDPDQTYTITVKNDLAVTVFTWSNVRDPCAEQVGRLTVYPGDPNGNLAGTAGSGSTPADAVLDSVNNIIWVCTTSGTFLSTVWTNTSSKIAGKLVYSGIISPSAISGQVDNYNPTGLAQASVIRINPSAEATLTGLAGGAKGREIVLMNIGTLYNLILADQHADSTEANRFQLAESLSTVMLPDACCVLRYDHILSRWFVKGMSYERVPGDNLYMANATFSASVATNALTIALKTRAGNNPSAADPVFVAIKTGAQSFYVYPITSALSLTISAGSTLGFTAGEENVIHVGIVDNAGTPALAASKDGGIWFSDRTINTTAEGGAGGADSATVIYAASTLSSVYGRLVCLVQIQTDGTTAGNWSNAPTRVSLCGTQRLSMLAPFKNAFRFWGSALGNGTAINDGFNLSSITDTSVGHIAFNLVVSGPGGTQMTAETAAESESVNNGNNCYIGNGELTASAIKLRSRGIVGLGGSYTDPDTYCVYGVWF